MYSLFSSPSKASTKKPLTGSGKGEQEWIVVNQKTKGKESMPSRDHEPDNATIHGKERESIHNDKNSAMAPISFDDRPSVPQYPRGIDTILSSMNAQRMELADMKKAFLEAQAQIQEERDLFQAQYYASRSQQEEREARHSEDRETAWKADSDHLSAEMALGAAEKSDELQYLRAELDDVKRALADTSSLSRSVQKQVHELKRDFELHSASSDDVVAQLQGHVADMARRISERTAAIAPLQPNHDDGIQAANAERKPSVSQSIAVSNACDLPSTRPIGPQTYGSTPHNADAQPHHSSERRASLSSAPVIISGHRRTRAKAQPANLMVDESHESNSRHNDVGLPLADRPVPKHDRKRAKYDLADHFSQLGLS